MTFPGLRVLVVEDEQPVRRLLSDLLRFWGCKVEVADDGKEGLEKYKQFRPDLVLMDLEMPVMDGFDASRKIMKLDRHAAIVLITGFLDTALAQKVLEKGLVKVAISKPFRVDELERAIQKAIEKPKLHSKPPPGEAGVT